MLFYKDISKDWLFLHGDNFDFLKNEQYQTLMKKIDLPHDWSVQSDFNCSSEDGSNGGFLQGGVAIYRKYFWCEDESLTTDIVFDGIFDESEVFLNLNLVGGRKYGYFQSIYRLENIKKGLNIIDVKVSNLHQPASRWFNGCGIFRKVWLEFSGQTNFVKNGIFVRATNIQNNTADIIIDAEIENYAENTTIKYSILDENCLLVKETFNTSKQSEITKSFKLNDITFWDIENPKRYNFIVEIFCNEVKTDEKIIRFGIRHIEWISNEGFFLNHKNIKLKGVCLHHDMPIVGAAATYPMIERRIIQLKNMGCNAIRTSHNPFSEDFYEICDKYGVLVIDEAFDGWEMPKAKYDYGTIFEECHKADLSNFVKKNRNHPSIISWSIGNEVVKMSETTTAKLMELVKNIDDTRPITCGVQGAGDESDKCRALLDVAGYNDGGGACFIYERDHERRPSQLMIATESPHTLQTRGYYRTQTWWRDKNQPRKEVENLTDKEIFFDGNKYYHSSYDNAGVRLNAQDCWAQTLKLPYLVGEFRWTGCDYYGESWGFPSRSLGYGVIDAANIPKDHFYLYKAMWDTKEHFIHFLPHWTHDEDIGHIPVVVYSNCTEVELFLNWKSLGKKEILNGSAMYLVEYEKGTLVAKGYIEGCQICHKQLNTSSNPEKITLEDVSFNVLHSPENNGEPYEIVATICDDKNNEVPYSNNVLGFYCDGGDIIGTENGDHTDLTNLTSKYRKAFYSKAMALIKPNSLDTCSVYVAGLLGDKYFDFQTRVNIDCTHLSFYGSKKVKEIRSFYSINGSDFTRFIEPFYINETSFVEAKIFIDNRLALSIYDVFKKGEKPVHIDVSHGNTTHAKDLPQGPYSSKLLGKWSNEELTIIFKDTGKVYRYVSESIEQKVGNWWYDFPIDFLEAQDYAGTGEIWFDSGEKAKISFSNQEAKILIIDNDSGGFSTAYECSKEIVLRKEDT